MMSLLLESGAETASRREHKVSERTTKASEKQDRELCLANSSRDKRVRVSLSSKESYKESIELSSHYL